MSALQIVTILVSMIVVGEAAALAVGMHIFKKSQSPWVSLKNDLLLALDVVVGLALIFLVFDSTNFPQPIWFFVFVIIGLLTHLFRFWENLARQKNGFCGNRALLILNNLKLIGLFVILGWGLLA